jgi:HJR/Mrr/RecB family endonuclease
MADLPHLGTGAGRDAQRARPDTPARDTACRTCVTGGRSSTTWCRSAARRRHGVHTALLSIRLADAAAAGCDIAVVTTQPGSRSQQNVQRQGFHLLYTRAVLIKNPRTMPAGV